MITYLQSHVWSYHHFIVKYSLKSARIDINIHIYLHYEYHIHGPNSKSHQTCVLVTDEQQKLDASSLMIIQVCCNQQYNLCKYN